MKGPSELLCGTLHNVVCLDDFVFSRETVISIREITVEPLEW